MNQNFKFKKKRNFEQYKKKRKKKELNKSKRFGQKREGFKSFGNIS